MQSDRNEQGLKRKIFQLIMWSWRKAVLQMSPDDVVEIGLRVDDGDQLCFRGFTAHLDLA
jgi:hypothetical protein